MNSKIAFIALVSLFAGTGKLYAQAPKIASYSPTVGPVGTQVTIKGSGFSSTADSNNVYFGATRAAVKTANASQLVVTVPVGATYKPIAITNKTTRLSGSSTLPFNTSFSPAATGLDAGVRLLPAMAAADVQIADIDGDGKTDILTTDPVSHKLMVYLNKSKTGKIDTGSFEAPVMFATGPQPGIAAIEDLDGDGKRDLVLMNRGYSAIPNGNNSLTLFQNISSPGHIKLAAAAITDSTETKPASYNFALKPGDNVTRISDFDGDGKPDMAVLNTAGFISIYRNVYVAGRSLKTMFGPPVTIMIELKPASFVIGDMDIDGKPDIVATNHNNSSMTVLRNIATIGAITPSSFGRIDIPLGYQPLTVSLADIDGDGKPDAVISRLDKPTALIHNTSSPGKFSGTSISLQNLNTLSNYNNDIVIQDVNGDAKPELLTLNADLTGVDLYANKSVPGQTTTNYFNTEIITPLTTIPDCIGDLDGDGMPDMIIGSAFGIDIYRSHAALAKTLLIQPELVKADKGDMVIYPNPASVSTHVQYTLPLRADALISVYNSLGKVFISFKTGMQDAGIHVNGINTSDLAMGIYVITIKAGNYQQTGKLIIK
ncbi:MAG: FG-GAP-like repeat-containing protein [Mucilaginibacter sp.]